jgi:GTP-binding protein
MIIRKSELLAVSVKKEQYPATVVPEIAFAGKSNVGKSSLINALLNRKGLARTSSQPGKTQTVNFYNVNNVVNFVDLPGYGYAKASKDSQEHWAKMIDTYLHGRKQLKEVVLLVDIRHEPNTNDKHMYEWIKCCGFTGYVVAAKADKLSKFQQTQSLAIIKKTLNIKNGNLIIPFSSVSKLGVEKLWSLFEELLDVRKK